MASETRSGEPGLTAPVATAGGWNGFLKRLVLGRLQRLREGRLELVDGRESQVFGRPAADGLRARITVRDPGFYRAAALGGSIGAAQAYRDGLWEADDLTRAVQVLARNREALEGLERGLTRLLQPLRSLGHALRSNSRAGSRRNIAAHYDLGNEFYELFLDSTMMYSCARFEDLDPPASATTEELGRALAAASVAKLDLICRKLDLKATDRVLEIGTGWGGFAIHAARNYGCHITTTTISPRQLEFARRRLRREGLDERVTLLDRDYRDLEGRFDKLVSIEMIEAVGHRYLDDFFALCSERLAPGGSMVLQAIVMADRYHEDYLRRVDFIQRHIFPGSCLPSISGMLSSLKGRTDLRLTDLEDLTPDYATTLKIWRKRFLDRRHEVEALGFSPEFVRLWEFYLRYCEGAFREHVIGDVQMVLAKPRSRPRRRGP